MRCAARRSAARRRPAPRRNSAASTRKDGEGRLDLVAFPGYAEAGGEDPRVNWVQPFVHQTGCKVHVRTVRSSTELLDVVARGRYDGVAAFGDITQVLTGGHEVEPIDTARIPNYARVYPALKRLQQNLEDGRVVGIPHGRGADVLLWRTDLVHRAPAGWDALFDPRYAGRVGWYDSAETLVRTAIHLRVQSPYELRPAQFRRVARVAAEASANAGFYWQDLTNALADYTGGNAVVGEATPRLAALLRADQVPVATSVPAGSTARSASWMLLRGARHPDCMYRWLDYILSAKANAASARYLHEAPATPAACAYMDCRSAHAGDEAWWSRLSFWRTPQRDCRDAPRRGAASTGSTGRTPGRAFAPAETDTTESVAASSAADVTLTTIRKTYGDVVAVDSIDLEIARGRVLHDARAVGLGQDDDAADHRRLRAARRRARRAARRGRHRPPAVLPRREHGLPGLRALPAHDGGPERRVRAAGEGREAAGAPRSAPTRRSRSSGSRGSATASRCSSPAASASGWRSRGRSSTIRRCCSSTSRSARST